MGQNSRTYKFALAESLLHFAREGHEDVPLDLLAGRYCMQLVEHLQQNPQAPASSQGAKDFLRFAQEDSDQILARGQPTERLVAAAKRNMPAMVMDKFHNVGGGALPFRFYTLSGRGLHQTLILQPELRRLAQCDEGVLLDEELSARWSIVETSFAAGVGSSLIQEGMLAELDQDGRLAELGPGRLFDVQRRRSVTGVRAATIGFQYGRCLICGTPITGSDQVAVDHVFPLALMRRAVWTWRGPDLDAVWNLAPAHYSCNAAKSDAWPSPAIQKRLASRNAAILESPHPLRRTLEATLRRAGVRGAAKKAAWEKLFSRVLTV
jgi:5-methylcytosine-specific restriction endonuclease McrA